MRARTAYLFFIIVACLIILAGLGYVLHMRWPLSSLAFQFIGGVGGYLLLVNWWAYLLTDDSPNGPLGAATHATVLGFVLILFTVTLRLMKYPLDAQLLTIIPSIGLLLLGLGLVISGRLPAADPASAQFSPDELTALGIGPPARYRRVKDPRADRYGLAPVSALTLGTVAGFLLILYAIAHTLQFAHYDRKLISVLSGVGVFIMLLSLWLYRKTGIVKIIRPYQHLGFGTFVCVLGLLLIFGMLSLHLMQLSIDLFQQRITLGGGVVLIGLGLILSRSGKQVIRLRDI